jgi:protocatechuate 3,4-dioxygenase beta subunit
LSGGVGVVDGGTLTYAWAQATGKTTSLSSNTDAAPTYLLPANGTNAAACTSGTGATGPTSNNCPRFQVVVTNTDTGLTSGTAVALAAHGSTAPGRPVANAGPDSYVKIDGGTVGLDGTASTQAQSHALTYQWTQTGGTAVTLSDATAAQPTFDAPGTEDILTFSLVVTDPANPIVSGTNQRVSVADTVVVRVTPDRVVADAGVDQTSRLAGQTITLDGSLSTEPDHEPLTYTWVQTEGPNVTLSDPNAVQPTFVAPPVTSPAGYTIGFELTVTNGGAEEDDTDTDTVSSGVVRSTPTVTVSRAPSGTVFTGDTVTLSANITNPDGVDPGQYSYTWAQASGRTTSLSSTTVANPTFVVPTSGSSATAACTSGSGTTSPTSANCPRFNVTVTNTTTGASSVVSVLATYGSSLPGRPTANAGPDQTVVTNTDVALAGSGTQAQGRALTYAWTQTGGDPIALTGADTASPTFLADEVGIYTFQLITTDPLNPVTSGNNQRTSLPDTVQITVEQATVGSISGTVKDTLGGNVEGAAVVAFPQGAGSIAVAYTGADGTYTFENVVPDSYKMAFVPPIESGLKGQWFDHVESAALATDVVVTAGFASTGIDADLVAGPTISGTVTDSEGNPLAGVTVGAYRDTDVWTGTATATTAADGTYTLKNVPPGSYRLRFGPSAGTGIAEWYDNSPSRAGAMVINVSEGGVLTDVDAELALTSTISGTVTDHEGNPLAGVTVAAYSPSNIWVANATAVTAADGTYTVQGLAPGSYRIRFGPPTGSGLRVEWYDNSPTRAGGTLINLAGGLAVTSVNAALEAL